MKKKHFYKAIISWLLLGAMALSLAGCDAKGGYEEVPEQTGEAAKPEASEINIVENGASDYQIVIPEDADSTTEFAASDLAEFIRLSTGVTLPTVTDAALSYDAKSKYISLGQTALLEQAGITVTKEQLGESGYIIKTVGSSLFISGITADTFQGTAYGIYDFLYDAIGMKTYAVDEIAYDKVETIPLYILDKEVRPSIDIRCLAMHRVMADRITNYRLRLIGSNSDVWSTFTHTLITTYLPAAKYAEAHPDWYANGNQQLCITNEEMIAELIVRVEELLDRDPTTTKVMLGHEDNNAVCQCDNCMAVANKYGGAYSGVELELTIKVAAEVDKWAAANYPGRKLSYAFFAYGPTLNAPVTYDEATDSFTANCPETVIPDNVGVLIAPIAMNFSKAPQDPENQAAYIQMRGWNYLFGGKNIAIWNYCLNAYSYFFNFNNFGVAKDYYAFYEEIGTSYIYDQGNYDSNICTFEDMRIFVQSQLMWDSTQSYEDLAQEFMEQYYGPAADAVKDYYNAVRAHYHYLEQNNAASGTVFFLLDDKNIWPVGVVNSLLACLDEALAALEPMKETDPERYQVLYSRVQKERLSPIYMMLSYYIDQLSDEAKNAYIKDFEIYTKMFGIESVRESSFGLQGLIEGWKKS